MPNSRIFRKIEGFLNPPFNLQQIMKTGGRCWTTQHEIALDAADPIRVIQKNELERTVQSRIIARNAMRMEARDSIKTIPLVIHVLYNKDRENISDSQIESQIEILNQDFSRTNPDASSTPDPFKDVAVDTGLRFCVVKLIRQHTNKTHFTSNDDVKFSRRGGSDAVDTSKYFNIWVCTIQEEGNRPLLGYGEFPTISLSKTYGVVVHNEAFGTGGITRSPYNRGRTLTHEIAHCFSVFHIFDESTSACTNTDKVNDIPTQSQPTYGCPSFPKTDKCSLNYPGLMFMNFMDYTNDSCMNCFTKEQAQRMISTLEVGPYRNLDKTGCTMLEGSALPLTPKFLQRKSTWYIGSAIIIFIILYFIFRRRQ